MLTDLWDFRQQLEEAQILICFNGPLSQSIIEEIGAAVKKYLETEMPGHGKLLDVFSVYIEQTQNIRNYSRRKAAGQGELPPYNGITLLIGRQGENYVVASGNIIDKGDIPPLRAALDHLRGLDAAALKALYKEQRRKPHDEHDAHAGAGLGLIDMARKTCQPLEYRLRDIDAGHAFFNLIAVI
ncbi:MAG: hypothetical protein HYV16_15890 [Gammaproteobacteria bacterium]|nr:hypothetical protein [Gammaproteobacteria bacterium]